MFWVFSDLEKDRVKYIDQQYKPGPSCSRLTISLVNVSLIIKYGIYTNIFAEKMWVAFAFANAKATHIFSAKIHVN